MKEINSESSPSAYEISSEDPFRHCDRSNGPRYYPRAPRWFSKQKRMLGEREELFAGMRERCILVMCD